MVCRELGEGVGCADGRKRGTLDVEVHGVYMNVCVRVSDDDITFEDLEVELDFGGGELR